MSSYKKHIFRVKPEDFVGIQNQLRTYGHQWSSGMGSFSRAPSELVKAIGVDMNGALMYFSSESTIDDYLEKHGYVLGEFKKETVTTYTLGAPVRATVEIDGKKYDLWQVKDVIEHMGLKEVIK